MHLRDHIKQEAARNRPPRRQVEVPEWGLNGEHKAFVRVLGISEHDALNRSFIVVRDGKMERDPKDYRAKFIAACLEDESGNLVFTADDLEWLKDQPTTIGEMLIVECHTANGIGEDTRKNS